ncbi:MAG: O-acetylhomoserine aminocarboxypropyltransferase/cysteine synthase [Proteobacteria bacterium]|nr:O-acetylhomoserine aminocarboxypropyltransferase/cysteine synthase [Pseudomonadota bacterium]
MKGFATKAIHGVTLKKDVHGALRMPVYDSVAFEFEKAKDLQLSFEGKKPAHAYSRITNPTVEDFEQRIRLLADAKGVIAFSSGMAAITNAIMGVAESGTNIVTSKFLFGNTVSLFEHTFREWGLETRYVDMNRPQSVADAIDDKTRAVFFEVITNPQLEVADAKKISEVAHEMGVPVIIDSTLTTPYLFKSIDFGIDIEVLSTTKYISGGASCVGGALIDNGIFDWKKNPKLKDDAKRYGPFSLLMKIRRELSRNIGTCLSPHNAYLQTLGLETLALRAEKSCANSKEVADFLTEHPRVCSVNYPGLESSRFHTIAKEQFKDRFGALLTFDLGSKDECFRLMDSLKIVRRATNLNDNKTLVVHPASTIFCEYSSDELKDMSISENTIRLAVGIEDAEDIIDDLRKGLEQL